MEVTVVICSHDHQEDQTTMAGTSTSNGRQMNTMSIHGSQKVAKEDLEDLGSLGVTRWQRNRRTSRRHGQITERLLTTRCCEKAVTCNVLLEHVEGSSENTATCQPWVVPRSRWPPSDRRSCPAAEHTRSRPRMARAAARHCGQWRTHWSPAPGAWDGSL